MPSPVHSLDFPKSARVRTRADYASAFEGARRLHGPLLQLCDNTAAGQTQARFGMAVSRKTDPLAIGRNRVKRVWRETFRLHRADLPAARYVAISKPPARTASNSELRDGLIELLLRASRLPGVGATGTMPADPKADAAPPSPSQSTPGRTPVPPSSC